MAGEEFGDDRIEAAIAGGEGRSAGDLLDRLVCTVRDFSAGAVQGDDMTAVVVRYTGAP